LKINGGVPAWARVVLCAIFVLAGSNFSHASELHHQISGSNSAHHSVSEHNTASTIVTPHKHFEPIVITQNMDEIATHCGSPELQPTGEIFSHYMVVAGTVGNCSQSALVGFAFGLEPPPPRS
jgi:hypothetical protein